MNCNRTINLMSDYVDGSLDELARHKFELHITECRDCSVELDAMRTMVDDLGSLGGCKSPVDCWAGVRRRIAESPPQSLWRTYLLRPAAAVPLFAVILLLSIFLIRPTPLEGPVSVSSTISVSEYSRYVSAHSRLRGQGAFSDPAVTFVAAELETAEITGQRE
jgi:hypothetical protein